MIRSFLAIELPATIRTKIEKIVADLRSTSGDVRWVDPEKIHLTLKFFGNIEESRVDSIVEAIEGPLRSTEPFELTVRGTGAFPSLNNPRVVWIGLTDAKGVLIPLQKEIDASLEKIGFEREDRVFRPHLTMGRVKTSHGKEGLIRGVEKYREEEMGEFRVEKAVLFRSVLMRSGAVYTPLREVKLGAQ